MSATLIEHRGVTVEMNFREPRTFRMPEAVEIAPGWYVSHPEVGETFIGKFVNNSARDEAARLWIEQMQRKGKL